MSPARRLSATDAGIVLIETGQVREVLSAALGNMMDDMALSMRVKIADQEYRCIDEDWLVSYVNTDTILANPPSPDDGEAFDCDDFSLYLKANLAAYARSCHLGKPLAVGCLMTQAHAFNFFIEDTGPPSVRLCDFHSFPHRLSKPDEDPRDFLQYDRSSNVIQMVLI